MPLRPDVTAVLLAIVLLSPRRGVGMRIKCGCCAPVLDMILGEGRQSTYTL
jgi:hypothetical protein